MLKLRPGSRAWLKATGSVSYPKNKFFGNRPHNNMNADLFMRLQDIVLRWREPLLEGADEKA